MRSRRSSAPGDPRPEVDAELAFHLEMLTRRFLDAGLDPVAARARALERLGDLDRVRARCFAERRELEVTMKRPAWHHGLRQDLRVAWRVLCRSPGFAATAILTIGIGIGATTAIFSVVNAVLLRGVPYADAGRLVMIWNSYASGLEFASISPAEFADLKDTQQAFEGLAAIRPQATTLTAACPEGGCEPERVATCVVSPALFTLLRTPPALGRPFVDADGAAGADRVVLLSDALWRRRFGADRTIVGRTISVGALAHTVVGVMPPDVRFPDAPVGFLKRPSDLWLPYNWEQSRTEGRGNQYLGVIARLRAEATIEAAQADLDRIASNFKARFPRRYARTTDGWRIRAVALLDQMIGDVRRALLLMLGAAGLVLLIACVNVANLLLAQGTSRTRELAVRAALGASRGQIVRQALVETAVLAGAGGILGIALATAGLRGLPALDPGTIPLLATARLDAAVLAFAVTATIVTALLVGLAPAIRQARIDPQAALADGGPRGTSGGPPRRRARRLLVVTEVAVAMVVLVAAGLLIRSFTRIQRVDTGFDPDGTLIAQVSLPPARYDRDAKVYGFHRDFIGRLARLPGAIAAGAVYPLPMSGESWSGTLYVEGVTPAPNEPESHAEYAVSMPGYFASIGIPLVEGRDFTAADTATGPPVAIVDETLARRHWPGESAVGKRLNPWQAPKDNLWTTVVGVVGHVRNKGHQAEGEPQVYLPALQKAELQLYYVVRSDPAAASLPSMRAVLAGVDPSLSVSTLAHGPDLVGRLAARERFNTLLVAIFGAAALALAGIGLYGVIAVLAGERRREIGIRLALGGTRGRVMSAIVGDGLTLTSAGVLAGLVCAIALSRTLSGLLFEIEPTDPLTYVAIAGVLILTTAFACFVPARRASHVDPVDVMRGP